MEMEIELVTVGQFQKHTYSEVDLCEELKTVLLRCLKKYEQKAITKEAYLDLAHCVRDYFRTLHTRRARYFELYQVSMGNRAREQTAIDEIGRLLIFINRYNKLIAYFERHEDNENYKNVKSKVISILNGDA